MENSAWKVCQVDLVGFLKEANRWKEVCLFIREVEKAWRYRDPEAIKVLSEKIENDLPALSAEVIQDTISKKKIMRWRGKAVELVWELLPVKRSLTIRKNTAFKNGKEKVVDILETRLSFLTRVSNRLVEMVRQLNTLL